MNPAAAQEPTLTKITAKILPSVYWAFTRQVRDALLLRDAFLDRVIANEISHIKLDLKGLKMSDEAKRYVSSELDRLPGKGKKLHPVSITVRSTTADALREVVKEHNLCRDSLINWIIILLRSTDKLLDLLDLPKSVSTTRGTDDMPTSPLQAIEAAQWDPFYYLRSASQTQYHCGLYTLLIKALHLPQLNGLSCYLPDEMVPKTDAYKERMKLYEEMESDLAEFESGLSWSALLDARAGEGPNDD